MKRKILIALTATALQLLVVAPAFAQNECEPAPLATIHGTSEIPVEVDLQADQDQKLLKGLVDVKRKPKKHWYYVNCNKKFPYAHFRNDPEFHVRTVGGDTRKFNEDEFKKLKQAHLRSTWKKFPDLRTYEDQHPIWHKTQVGFTHWNPALDGVQKMAIPAVMGATLPRRNTVKVEEQ